MHGIARDVSRDYLGALVLENLNLEMFIMGALNLVLFRRNLLPLNKDSSWNAIIYFENGKSCGSSVLSKQG